MSIKIIPERKEVFCDSCMNEIIEDINDNTSITICMKSYLPIKMDFCHKCFVKLTKSLPFRAEFLFP